MGLAFKCNRGYAPTSLFFFVLSQICVSWEILIHHFTIQKRFTRLWCLVVLDWLVLLLVTIHCVPIAINLGLLFLADEPRRCRHLNINDS